MGASINAVMMPDEIPPFPVQLGCSGFVIIDQAGNIVTTRSSPSFLDAGEDSFRAVESLLCDLGIPISRKIEESGTPQVILKPLPHVGHCKMDAEHAEIDKSLAELVETPTRHTLVTMRKVLADHFLHEEAFLQEKAFGQPQGGSLSAYDSHVSDHARILHEVDNLLGLPTVNKISSGKIDRLINMIYQHGVRFDSLYANKISCESCTKVEVI